MNGISSRQKPIGPIATSMNGRRRPIGVWNESLQGPTTGESRSAKTPSAPRTTPIRPPECVNLCRSGGRYAAVVVIEKASPNAPSPSVQSNRRGGGLVGVAQSPESPCGQTRLDSSVEDVPGEPRGEVGADRAVRLAAPADL